MKFLSQHYAAALILAAFGFTSYTDGMAKEQASLGRGAVPGFYIQIEMCHACAYPGWQNEAASELGKYGLQAFASDDITSYTSDHSFAVLKALPLRTISDEGWPIPIYVGPFKTYREAY